MANTLEDALNASVVLNDNVVDAAEAEIIPGTTPDILFGIDSNILKDVKTARIDITQNKRVLVQDKNVTVNENSIVYHLSQEQTYTFKEGYIRIQIHGINNDGTSWKTQIQDIKIGETLTSTMIE